MSLNQITLEVDYKKIPIVLKTSYGRPFLVLMFWKSFKY